MANYDTSLLKKNVRQRGVYGGKEQSVTGILRFAAGSSVATTGNLLRMMYIGENVRPIRLVLTSTPVEGNPVLTNPTFNCGVAPHATGPYTRYDGTVFPEVAADADALAAALVINTDNMNQVIEVNRPVANSVPLYAPTIVTLTPAGAGAFSVAGGTIDLALTVYFVGEQKTDGFVYDEYVNQKYQNEA